MGRASLSAHDYVYNGNIFKFPNLANLNTRFYSSDSESAYQENTGKFDKYYYDVSYSFNSAGYRAPDFDAVKSPFALIHGCSHTEGVGLHEHDLWSTKICKHFGWQCVNLAKSGSAADFNILNSMMWFNSDLPKPKIVLFQVPNVRRFATFEFFEESFKGAMTNSDTLLQRASHELNINENTFHFLEEDSLSRYDSNAVKLDIELAFLKKIWESAGVRFIAWSWDQDMHDRLQTVNYLAPEGDERANTYGRDMRHAGYPYHDCLTEFLKEIIRYES